MGVVFKPAMGGGFAGFYPLRRWEEECAVAKLDLADRLTGDRRNVGAGDAEVGKLALRQAVQFAAGLAVTAPVVVAADDVVHGSHLGVKSIETLPGGLSVSMC